MPHSPAIPVMAAVLVLAAAYRPPGGSTAAPRQQPDTVVVTAAHGLALVPVRIITSRDAVLSATGRGTWSGDTLRTRTPLVLTLRSRALPVTIQTVSAGTGVRVTLTGPNHHSLDTRAGPRLRLKPGPAGWSLALAS